MLVEGQSKKFSIIVDFHIRFVILDPVSLVIISFEPTLIIVTSTVNCTPKIFPFRTGRWYI